ncbi:MAG: hypothetical protein IBX61_01600 [Thermoleophilia bacterium]|nr:hypothetical protein [Thermoleophilia bacterium]
MRAEANEVVTDKALAGEFNLFVHPQIHDTFNEFLTREEGVLRERLKNITMLDEEGEISGEAK